MNELATQFGAHPTLIHGWKKQLLAGAEAVFAGGAKTSAVGNRTRTSDHDTPVAANRG